MTTMAGGQKYFYGQLTRRTFERRAIEATIWGMAPVNVDYMRQANFPAGAR